MQERLEEGGSGAGEEAVRDFYSWDDKGQSQHVVLELRERI